MNQEESAELVRLREELEQTKRIILILFMAYNGQPLGAKEIELRAWIERQGATTHAKAVGGIHGS